MATAVLKSALACRHARRLLKYGIGLGPRALDKLPSSNEDSWEGRKIGSPAVIRDMQQLRRSMHGPLHQLPDSSDDDDPDGTSNGGGSSVCRSQFRGLQRTWPTSADCEAVLPCKTTLHLFVWWARLHQQLLM